MRDPCECELSFKGKSYRCPHCKKTLQIPSWDYESFIKNFKIGDIVTAWPTDRAVVITAIGRQRILFEDRGKECVGSLSLKWRKI